jgi:hypothetical protein
MVFNVGAGRNDIWRLVCLLLLAGLLLPGCTTYQAPQECAVGQEDAIPSCGKTPVKAEPGLVAHWGFDENGGNTVRDSVGGLEGTVYGAVPAQGRKGGALYFDGVDDYVRLSDEAHDRLSRLGQGTIAFWFKFESVLDKQSIMPMFYLGGADGGQEDNILIIEVGHFKQGNLRAQDPDNKRLYSTFIKDGGHPFLCLDSGRSMEEGAWTHYALVSGQNGTNVYINGQGIPANYNFGALGDAYFMDDVPDTETIMIGRGKTSSMATPDFVYFKGYIDDLRAYERPLSPEEIMGLQ